MGRPFDPSLMKFSTKPSSALADIFHFSAGPLTAKLTFTQPQAPYRTLPRKRCRPLNDVDGENSAGSRKKKRRLRLFLITSRLSPIFSQPATYIVDRGSSKIAVWAKQKSLGRNLLRKAAILNRIRKREKQEQETQTLLKQEQAQMEKARETFLYGAHDTYTHPVVHSPNMPFRDRHDSFVTDSPAPLRGPYLQQHPHIPESNDSTARRKPLYNTYGPYGPNMLPSAQVPRRDYIPLPPSPLGLSNYDAFDLEDDFAVDDGDGDGDDAGGDSGGYDWTASSDTVESPSSIYSDFSVLDPMESVVDDHDLIEAFAGTSTTAGVGALEVAWNESERKREAEQRKHEERMAEIKEEKERQRKVLFTGLPTFV